MLHFIIILNLMKGKAVRLVPIKGKESQDYLIGQGRQSRMNNGFVTRQKFDQMLDLMKGILKKQPISNQSFDIEPRDRDIILELPQNSLNGVEQKDLKMWVTKVVRTVVSASFNYYSKGDMSFEQSKVFCSQNVIKNIANLNKIQPLRDYQIQMIDKHMESGILTYMGLKYPMVESTEINKKLESIVEEVNNMELLSNNYLSSSRIMFEYRQSGNYNDLIMKLLNELFAVINESDGDQEDTLYEQFQNYMSNFFEKLYDKNWVKDHEKLSQTKLNKHISSFIVDFGAPFSQDPPQMKTSQKDFMKKAEQMEEKQKFKSKVKQYTNYQIGRKISPNVPTFSDKQIQTFHLTIKSSKILRVLDKWCNELWEKFSQPNFYSSRSQEVRVIKGSNVHTMPIWMRKYIDERLEVEKVDIQIFLEDLNTNNYKMQSAILAKQNEDFGDYHIDSLEKNCGKYSVHVVHNLHRYTILYLNKLIHGLLKVSKDVFDKQIYAKKLQFWPSPPNLLTLTISDLIRCKCHSKEEQIVKLYNQMMHISITQPKKLKIVRVKNRLRRGTNDILVNVLFNNKILCEIQLGVVSKISQFIKCSNEFNHFLYELKRSIFGPLTQLCSVWSSHDDRIQCFRQAISKQKKKNNYKPHTCSTQRKMKQYFLPFICSNCNFSYHHNNYLRTHKKCQDCEYFLCGRCSLDTEDEKQLIKTFIESKSIRSVCKKRVKQNTILPDNGVCLSIESAVAKVQVFKFIEYKKQIYLLGKKGRDIYLIESVSNKKIKSLFQKYIIFEIDNTDNSILSLTHEDAIKQFILPKIMKKHYISMKQTLSLMGQNLTTSECEAILNNGSSAQKNNIKTLLLAENNIDDITFVGSFPNLSTLQINGNSVKNFNAIKELTHLKKIVLEKCQTGKIPQEIYQVKSIDFLNGSNNGIMEILPQILNIRNLKTINLSKNLLKKLPEQITQCERITYLHLQNNEIEELPEEIGNLKLLKKFYINNNKVSKIPLSFKQLANLKDCNMENNRISNLDQINFEKLTDLAKIYFNGNGLEKFPQNLIQTKNLKGIILSNNKIKEIPKDIGKLKKLRGLKMNDNLFEEIPSCIGQCKGLEYIMFKNNQISNIPQFLITMTKMEKVVLEGNKIKYLHLQIDNMKKIVSFDLSKNQIQKISEVTQKSQKFHHFNLKGNPIQIDRPELFELQNKDRSEKLIIEKTVLQSKE